MTAEYTPTLEDARRTYAYIQGGLDHDEGYKPFYQVHEEAFDRMIEDVTRKAAADAWAEGHAAGEQNAADGIAALLTGLEAPEPKANPYRDEKEDHGNDS